MSVSSMPQRELLRVRTQMTHGQQSPTLTTRAPSSSISSAEISSAHAITSTGPFLESSCELTLGKPDSSHSLIIPMKSMDLVAMNSARKADITELSNKALEDTYTNSGVP